MTGFDWTGHCVRIGHGEIMDQTVTSVIEQTCKPALCLEQEKHRLE